MKVSIVTISFNQVEFLERCIQSIITQSYKNIEYIVVDPGSTDGSIDVLERYRAQIDRLIIEPDNGPADGLNKGFAAATGDIYFYLNSDDVLMPGALQEVVEIFQKKVNLDVICGHGYMVDAKGNKIRRFYSDPITPWRYVHGGSVIMQQSTFFRAEAFHCVGGFNSCNPIWWDGELMLEFSLAGKNIEIINRFWSVFTIHDNSISGQKDLDSHRSHILDAQRIEVRERLFVKALGKKPDKFTKYFVVMARVQKWCSQPVGTIWRVLEKLGLVKAEKIL